MTTQSDDQRVLASECLNESLRLIIINLLRNYALWQLFLAVNLRDCRNGVPTSLERGFSNVAAAVATSLRSSVDDLQAKLRIA